MSTKSSTTSHSSPTTEVPRIESLKVAGYRALRSLQFTELTPLTVLLGPNGSGKSTVFDVFAFLSECFSVGLRKAWDKRGRFKELRSRGAEGPIVFELKYREREGTPLITYHLEIDEEGTRPSVAREWLRWSRRGAGRPFNFLDFSHGSGEVITGDTPDEHARRFPETLDSPDLLAVNTLGQFARNPRVAALRRFITGWYLSYLAADNSMFSRASPSKSLRRGSSGTSTPFARPIAACPRRSPTGGVFGTQTRSKAGHGRHYRGSCRKLAISPAG